MFEFGLFYSIRRTFEHVCVRLTGTVYSAGLTRAGMTAC